MTVNEMEAFKAREARQAIDTEFVRYREAGVDPSLEFCEAADQAMVAVQQAERKVAKEREEQAKLG